MDNVIHYSIFSEEICSRDPSNVTFPDNSVKKIKQTKKKRRHVPHSQQPRHLVIERNARERARINSVNDELRRLRNLLPLRTTKRVSKERILELSIRYIDELRRMIKDHDDLSRRLSLNQQDVNKNVIGFSLSSVRRLDDSQLENITPAFSLNGVENMLFKSQSYSDDYVNTVTSAERMNNVRSAEHDNTYRSDPVSCRFVSNQGDRSLRTNHFHCHTSRLTLEDACDRLHLISLPQVTSSRMDVGEEKVRNDTYKYWNCTTPSHLQSDDLQGINIETSLCDGLASSSYFFVGKRGNIHKGSCMFDSQ